MQLNNENDRKIRFTEDQKQKINIPFKILREFDADWDGAALGSVNVKEIAKYNNLTKTYRMLKE